MFDSLMENLSLYICTVSIYSYVLSVLIEKRGGMLSWLIRMANLDNWQNFLWCITQSRHSRNILWVNAQDKWYYDEINGLTDCTVFQVPRGPSMCSGTIASSRPQMTRDRAVLHLSLMHGALFDRRRRLSQEPLCTKNWLEIWNECSFIKENIFPVVHMC